MIEVFELIGYKRIHNHINGHQNVVWAEIAMEEFDSYPTDEEKLAFATRHGAERVWVRKVDYVTPFT